jgi:hypothetical protein
MKGERRRLISQAHRRSPPPRVEHACGAVVTRGREEHLRCLTGIRQCMRLDLASDRFYFRVPQMRRVGCRSGFVLRDETSLPRRNSPTMESAHKEWQASIAISVSNWPWMADRMTGKRPKFDVRSEPLWRAAVRGGRCAPPKIRVVSCRVGAHRLSTGIGV